MAPRRLLEPAKCKPHVKPSGWVGVCCIRSKRGLIFRGSLGQVAQLVEQWTENPCVGGSIPSLTTIRKGDRPQPAIAIPDTSTDSQHPRSCTRFEDDRIFAAASTEADGPVVQFG